MLKKGKETIRCGELRDRLCTHSHVTPGSNTKQ